MTESQSAKCMNRGGMGSEGVCDAHAEKNWPADERRYAQIRKATSDVARA